MSSLPKMSRNESVKKTENPQEIIDKVLRLRAKMIESQEQRLANSGVTKSEKNKKGDEGATTEHAVSDDDSRLANSGVTTSEKKKKGGKRAATQNASDDISIGAPQKLRRSERNVHKESKGKVHGTNPNESQLIKSKPSKTRQIKEERNQNDSAITEPSNASPVVFDLKENPQKSPHKEVKKELSHENLANFEDRPCSSNNSRSCQRKCAPTAFFMEPIEGSLFDIDQTMAQKTMDQLDQEIQEMIELEDSEERVRNARKLTPDEDSEASEKSSQLNSDDDAHSTSSELITSDTNPSTFKNGASSIVKNQASTAQIKTTAISMTSDGKWDLLACVQNLLWDTDSNLPLPQDMAENNWDRIKKNKRPVNVQLLLNKAAELNKCHLQDVLFIIIGYIKMMEEGKIRTKYNETHSVSELSPRSVCFDSELLPDDLKIVSPMLTELFLKEIMAEFDVDDEVSSNIDDLTQAFCLAVLRKFALMDKFFSAYCYPSTQKNLKYVPMKPSVIVNIRSATITGLNLTKDEQRLFLPRIKKQIKQVFIHFIDNERRRFVSKHGQTTLDNSLEDVKKFIKAST